MQLFKKELSRRAKTKAKSINGSRRASMNIFSHVGIIAHLSNEITFQVFQKIKLKQRIMHEQTQNCDDQSIFLIFFISFIFKNSFKGRISKNFLHLQIMRRCQLKNRLGHTVVTMELMLWEIVLKQPHKRLLLRLERNPEHHSYAKKGVNHDIPQSSQTRCLKITGKVSFNVANVRAKRATFIFKETKVH